MNGQLYGWINQSAGTFTLCVCLQPFILSALVSCYILLMLTALLWHSCKTNRDILIMSDGVSSHSFPPFICPVSYPQWGSGCGGFRCGCLHANPMLFTVHVCIASTGMHTINHQFSLQRSQIFYSCQTDIIISVNILNARFLLDWIHFFRICRVF